MLHLYQDPQNVEPAGTFGVLKVVNTNPKMAASGNGAKWNTSLLIPPGKKEALKGERNHTLTKENSGAYKSS